MKVMYELVWSMSCAGLCGLSFILGVLYNQPEKIEQHPYCFDTKTHEAWIARRESSIRCFMEHRQYPHRVKASYIDEHDN